MFQNESIYIAGPECFYPNGYALWNAMRKKAEYYGFRVTMPNDNPLKLDHEDLRLNGDAIFEGCRNAMASTTILIADLDLFRSTEADGGTLFEMGMAYAKGCRVYGFARDKRSMACKNPFAQIRRGVLCAQGGQPMPYPDLPYAPSVIATCKLLEGSFNDCLQMVMADLLEAEKVRGRGEASRPAPPLPQTAKRSRPLVYLSGCERYAPDAASFYAEAKQLCAQMGMDAASPLDGMNLTDGSPYARAAHMFAGWEAHVRAADIIIANLNDFHGWEPCNDTAIECGMAFQYGKRLIGYMEDTACMRKRIPNEDVEGVGLDWCGNIVENFNYPINIMFASAMPIVQGTLAEAIKAAGGA